MFDVPPPLKKLVAANTPTEWAIAGAIVVLSFLVALLLRRLARRQYQRFAETEAIELIELPLEVASRTRLLFLLAASLYLGLGTLTVHARTWQPFAHVVLGIAFWQAGVWGSGAVDAWLRVRRKASMDGDREAAGSLGLIGFIARFLVWTLVSLLALDNFGIDITTLVAGLGVGGIAVALAVQNVLGDLFASLSITLDRPFVIGDLVEVDAFIGHVEHIGVKSTRLRSISGEQIIMANADLLGSRVRNYGRMEQRRILFTLGVTYETAHDKLKAIPALIRECIEHQPGTRFDRSHFSAYGDFSLNFETVYYVLDRDYTIFMDAQQEIFFAIHAAFEKEGIEFAYPTQKLWMAKVPD